MAFFRSPFLFLSFNFFFFQVHNFSYCCWKRQINFVSLALFCVALLNSIFALSFWSFFFLRLSIIIIYCVFFFLFFSFIIIALYIWVLFFSFRCAQNTKSKNRAQIIFIHSAISMLSKLLIFFFRLFVLFFTLFKWFNHSLPQAYFLLLFFV